MKGEFIMTINSVSFGNYYVPTQKRNMRTITPEQEEFFKTHRVKVNPYKDKVFIDPKTGEKTTWKPGIYNPEQNDTKKTTKNVGHLLALAAAGVLAFAFRGKIKTGAQGLLNKAKPVIERIAKRVPQNIKTFIKKGIQAAEPVAKKVIDFAKTVVIKANSTAKKVAKTAKAI